MSAELGLFELILALVLALAQSTIPFYGAIRGDRRLMAVAAPVAVTQFLLVAAAFASLVHAHVVSDFSVLNVVENSHSAKPLLYKITGVWGNHEGSMLLWVLILSLFGALVAVFGGNLPDRLKARVLSVQAWIAVRVPPLHPVHLEPLRSGSSRRRSRATTSTRCSRTSASPSIRRSSISAMSAARSPSPSRWPR